jgi:hypothetical protein
LTDEVNCTPRFAALVSAADATDGCAVDGHRGHGHWDPAVVKVHEYGLLIDVPELFCAPDTVAVYVVSGASGLEGMNVATVSALLKLTDPAAGFPPESFTANDTVLGTTAWENVAIGATVTGLPDDPGVELVTVGPKAPGAIVNTTSTQ